MEGLAPLAAALSDWIRDAPETLGDWAYAFAALMAFLEFSSLLGVPLPFEVGVVLTGAVAGEGQIDLVPLIVCVWIAASVGESINFVTGDRLGRPFLERRGLRFRVTPQRLAWVDDRFERHGALFVLVGRFIPFVRSSMPFVAGTSHMTYRAFLPWSIGGNLLWATVFCGLGFVFYESAGAVADSVELVGVVVLVAIAATAVAAAAWLLVRRSRSPTKG